MANSAFSPEKRLKKGPQTLLQPLRLHQLFRCGFVDLFNRSSIINVPVGKASFEANQLDENISTLMDAIVKAKPASAKGTYLKSVAISSTMGPGIRLNAQRFL